MIFGYMRISTKKENQSTDRQLFALMKYAAENKFTFDKILKEIVSGNIKAENREEYKKLKYMLRKDDILVITDLDRLGRNADDVIMELKELKSLGVRVIALDMPYMSDWNKANDDSIYDMVVDIIITIKAHMAQQEREKIISRINQGLDVARANGKKLGRPKVNLPKDFYKEYRKFKNGEYGSMSASNFAKMMGIGRSTLYKYIKILNNEL